MSKRTPPAAFDRIVSATLLHRTRCEEAPVNGGTASACPSEIIEAAYLESLVQLSRIIELRDDKTGEHTVRVARLSGLIAENLHISPEDVRGIYKAAPVHDIGKVVVPDKILLKPGPLTEEEQITMRRHTTLASEILKGSTSELIRTAEQVARHHHERWDGQGYPDGLMAEEIPLAARIVAVADAFDAMVNDRPYRLAVPFEEVRDVFGRESGWQFDPLVVEALFRALECRGTPMVVPRIRHLRQAKQDLRSEASQ